MVQTPLTVLEQAEKGAGSASGAPASSRKILVMYFDAGGGHRNAANALLEVARQQQRSWDLKLVNLQELLDELDIIRKVSGLRVQEVYNQMLRRGWTLGSAHALKVLHLLIRWRAPKLTRELREFWMAHQPDMVVSVIPNFNRIIAESLRATLPKARFVTILTDIADYPPHFWIERESQYVICGSTRAAEQACAFVGADRVFRTSGMILHPRFYDPKFYGNGFDREAERKKHGFDPKLATGICLFGGHGSSRMRFIARELQSWAPELQMIYICGHNAALKEELEKMLPAGRNLVVGFTSEVPLYMAMADFLIGKAGPGSLSEAVHMGLPAIVEANAWTLPQERYNAQWLVENETGVSLRDFRDIGPTVGRILHDGSLGRMRERAAALQNRAVFEIPDILERLLPHAAEPLAQGRAH